MEGWGSIKSLFGSGKNKSYPRKIRSYLSISIMKLGVLKKSEKDEGLDLVDNRFAR